MLNFMYLFTEFGPTVDARWFVTPLFHSNIMKLILVMTGFHFHLTKDTLSLLRRILNTEHGLNPLEYFTRMWEVTQER